VDRDALRRFVDRDYQGLARLKRDHWAERHRREGGEAGLRAAQALREHARSVRSDWPTARERAEDLAHHLELKRLLDLVSRAVADR
jgi:hypothetical protein